MVKWAAIFLSGLTICLCLAGAATSAYGSHLADETWFPIALIAPYLVLAGAAWGCRRWLGESVALTIGTLVLLFITCITLKPVFLTRDDQPPFITLGLMVTEYLVFATVALPLLSVAIGLRALRAPRAHDST